MYRKGEEKLVQKELAYRLKASVEVQTPVGVIDLLTSNKLIEIKYYKYYKAAIGQIIVYGNYFPNHLKTLFLFGNPPKLDRYKILHSCKDYEIEVVFDNAGQILLQ